MRHDGARSATRKEQEGVTCATSVTRGTFDFQARDNFELRDKEFARKFHVRSAQSRLQAKVSRTCWYSIACFCLTEIESGVESLTRIEV
jgi:hypothetical protein